MAPEWKLLRACLAIIFFRWLLGRLISSILKLKKESKSYEFKIKNGIKNKRWITMRFINNGNKSGRDGYTT